MKIPFLVCVRLGLCARAGCPMGSQDPVGSVPASPINVPTRTRTHNKRADLSATHSVSRINVLLQLSRNCFTHQEISGNVEKPLVVFVSVSLTSSRIELGRSSPTGICKDVFKTMLYLHILALVTGSVVITWCYTDILHRYIYRFVLIHVCSCLIFLFLVSLLLCVHNGTPHAPSYTSRAT